MYTYSVTNEKQFYIIKIAGNTAIVGSLWKLFNGVKGVKVKVNYLMSLVIDVDT